MRENVLNVYQAGDHEVRLGDQIFHGCRVSYKDWRWGYDERAERGLACCYCRLSGKDQVKRIVVRLVDVLAAQMIQISQTTTI